MKKALFAVVLALVASVGSAQNTAVSTTGVVDSDGTTWAGATWKISFVVSPTEPNKNRYINNGAPVSESVLNQNGTLNGSGAATITVYDNTLTTPLGSQWQLSICPNATWQCFLYTFVASGTTLNLTTVLNSLITPPRFQAIAGTKGYADVEVLNPSTASTYWNVTSACQKTYNGSSWICSGGGSGTVSGQTVTCLPKAANATTLSAPSSVCDDGTNVSTPELINSLASVPAVQPVADVTNPAYGALGTGNPHDDAPAIRAAQNAVMARGGGKIFIPKGTYYLGSKAPVTTDPNAASFVFYGQGNHIHFVCDPEAVIDAAGVPFSVSGPGELFGFGFPSYSYLRPTSPIGGFQTSTGYQANVLPLLGSSTITLTTPSDNTNFAVGDPIYILGGPGTESNGDGEINWITAINAGTGVINLRMPTSKPYTGNLSNVGAPNIVTIIPGVDHSQSPAVSRLFDDVSVEGCHVINLQLDFVYIGQVAHAKIMNNRVEVDPSPGIKGMAMQSYFPMADIEMGGNYYVQGSGEPFTQLADGMREVNIHDNTLISPYGISIINPSQGVVNTHLHHNSMYLTMPSTVGNNQAAIIADTVYGMSIDGNIINVNNLSTNTSTGGVILGVSNGVCQDCTFVNNILHYTTVAGAAQAALLNYGTNLTITGNQIFVNGARYGIEVTNRSSLSYSNSTVVGNKITSFNEPASYTAIAVLYSGAGVSPQSEVVVNSNQIIGSGGANGTGIWFSAAGGGVVSGNQIYNLPAAFALSGGPGTPLLMGNECTNVSTTTNCGSPGIFSGNNTWTGSNTYTSGTQDFHASAHTLPSKSGTVAAIPATCTLGEEYFATNAAAGANKYFCTATNVWTQGGGSSGAALAEWQAGGFMTTGLNVTANGTFLWSFVLPGSNTSTKISFKPGTADNSANLYSIGIYSASGTLLCDVGPTAGTTFAPNTNLVTLSWLSSCALTGGTRYLLALTNVTATAILNTTGPQFQALARVAPSAGGTTVGAQLTGSITPPADSWNASNFPLISLHN